MRFGVASHTESTKLGGLDWRIINKEPCYDIAGTGNVKPLSAVTRMAWEINQIAA